MRGDDAEIKTRIMYIMGNYSLWIGAAARQRHRQPGGPPSINHGGDELRTHIPGCHLFPGPVGEVRIELQKFISCEPHFLEPAGLAVYSRHKAPVRQVRARPLPPRGLCRTLVRTEERRVGK